MNEITDRMKKYLFILSAVSMALFTACSSADDLAETVPGLTPEEREAIITEANMDSEVQIRLGMGSPSSSSSVTRAPLESDNNGYFETPTASDPGGAKYLGIYCLAQKNQKDVADPGPVAPGSILWNSTDSKKLFYLMNRNQAAQVKKITGAADKTLGNVPFTSGTVSEVQFMNDGLTDTEIHYYPYGNWYNYYFYGYYPRQTTGITEAASRISVNYTLNGTQDIIWGKAIPTTQDEADPDHDGQYLDADKGFNAKYFRDRLDNGVNDMGDLPALAMDHKLTQLRFWVKTSSATYNSYGYGDSETNGKKTFQITDLKLTKVPASWTLVIADRTNSDDDEGKLINGSAPTDLSVRYMGQDNTTKEAAPATASDDNTFGASTKIDIPYIASTDNTSKPKLLGYLMVPTTKMMEGVTISGRDDATIPFIDFSISYGAVVGDNSSTAKTWEFTDQTIKVPREAGTDGILNTQDDIVGFQPGTVYNVILNIPTPEEIAMIATLNDWEWVTVTAGGDKNIPVEVD